MAQRVPGRRGPVRESHAPHLALSLFRRRTAAAPASGDVTMGLQDWGMLGNGPTPGNLPEYATGAGDCGVAAFEHGRMAKALERVVAGSPHFQPGFVRPTTPYTQDLYARFGRAMGEPGQYPDQGVTNARWLGWLHDVGLVDWYGELDTRDPDEIHAVMLAARGVLMAVQLPEDAEQQFADGQPWQLDTSTIEGGHDILLVRYSPDGDTFVTWGALQMATVRWDAGCVLDAWAFGTREDAERAGYDFAAIKAAIHAAGGAVTGS